MLKAISVVLALLLVPTIPPISLSISPRQAFGPITVAATIHIQPDTNNSELCLYWDSDEGETGSNCRSIDTRYPPTTIIPLRLYPGDYNITAAIYRDHIWYKSNTLQVTILSKQ